METSTEISILEAAKKLFMEKGFAMTSTADIAREAECNTAMIHYYYRSKDNLFNEVFFREIEKFSGGFLMIPTADLSFEEKVVMLVNTHFEFLQANPRLPFLLMNELTINPKRIDDFKTKAVEKVKSIALFLQKEIDKELANGTIREITAMEILANIVSLNVMQFLIEPIVLNIGLIGKDEFVETRRREVVKTIVNSFKIYRHEK